MRLWFTAALLACCGSAQGSIITLSPPSPSNVSSGVGPQRGVFVTALSNFSITSLGVEADLAGASLLTARVFAASGTVRGALLATQSFTLSDTGLAFQDVPISFSFTAGTDYDLEIGFVPNPSTARFFSFNAPSDAPFDVGGLVRVRDGEFGGDPGNTVLANFRMNVTDASVPEPASMAIWGLGALGCAIAGYRRRKLA